MGDANKFCIGMLLATFLCLVIGIFLVTSSLYYSDTEDEKDRPLPRRSSDEGDSENDSESANKELYPVFPDDYHASGLLILPHSSIAEPFEIWYSNTLGASRIDYYYGKVSHTILKCILSLRFI